jgi:hypothetical protein
MRNGHCSIAWCSRNCGGRNMSSLLSPWCRLQLRFTCSLPCFGIARVKVASGAEVETKFMLIFMQSYSTQTQPTRLIFFRICNPFISTTKTCQQHSGGMSGPSSPNRGGSPIHHTAQPYDDMLSSDPVRCPKRTHSQHTIRRLFVLISRGR